MTTTTDDELLKLAEAATPGPWFVSERGIWSDTSQVLRAVDGHVWDEYDSDPAEIDIDPPNAAYIAAASPDRVKALIEALDEADAE